MTYQPTKDSLSTHNVPAWFHDAKLGIFIHWGRYSVPAYAAYADAHFFELIHSFVDIVSKNGNLLLNVGPKADGTISDLPVPERTSVVVLGDDAPLQWQQTGEDLTVDLPSSAASPHAIALKLCGAAG